MGQTNSKVSAPSAGRLWYLDNLRAFLTALVIFHHTSIPFGGLGSWPYTSPHYTQGSYPSLVTFNALNQSFFMGSFFYLSGIMSSQSLKRKKSVRGFLKTKWLKLGVPVVVYTLLGPPLQTIAMRLCRRENLEIVEALLGHWTGIRSVRGPVWYPALLLLFDTIYSLLPHFRPPNLGCWQTMLLDITASFLLQVRSPLSKVFRPLNLQPGYFPQYLICYMLGTHSSPNGPSLLTPRRRNVLLAASVLSGSCMLGLLHSNPERYSLSSLNGSFNPVALSYTVWNETTGLILGASLLRLFERREWTKRRWGDLAMYSYGAFVVHPIICVGVQAAFEAWNPSGLIKTAVCGTLGVMGSWGVAWGLVRVPGVNKILL